MANSKTRKETGRPDGDEEGDSWIDRVLKLVDSFLDDFKGGEEDHVDDAGASHGDAESCYEIDQCCSVCCG